MVRQWTNRNCICGVYQLAEVVWLKFKSALAKVLSLFALAVFLSSCNSFFYYPHPDIYTTPDKVTLSYREVTIPVDQDVTLKAWHIYGQNKLPAPVAVLQFHGNAENRSTHFFAVAWLAKAGADVVAVDYRGYDGSTGEPSRSGLVDDGVAALKWFEREFPNSRRYVIGQSLGGAVALPAIVKSGVKLDGVILESTFHSYRGIARIKLASRWLTWPFQWLPWIVLSGDEDPEDVASQLKIPALVFHDRHDPVVEYESGAILYAKLPAATTRVFVNDGNRHAAAFSKDRPDYRQETLRFLGMAAQNSR